MQKVLIVLFLTISISLSGATYYVATNGSNTNNGSNSSPWKTLAYACSKATTSGDIIHVKAGTYIETTQSLLAVGVSIEGEGISSNIISRYSAGALISAEAPSVQGTNGNQSISYIKLDGDNLTGESAIKIGYRSNVLVHHCTIINFYRSAVYFYACYQGEPAKWATGNKIYDNIITNCATCEYDGTLLQSNVNFGGQSGMEIYNNTIYQPNRGANITGEALSYCRGGWAKGMKIYNNSILVDPSPGSLWNGVAEFFECKGGMEIYNNAISGTLDFSCNLPGENGSTEDYSLTDEGGYGFALKIYNNRLLYPARRSGQESAIDIERNVTGGVYIYNNYFENLYRAVRFSFSGGVSSPYNVKKDIYIYYNLFKDIGIPGDPAAGDAISIGSAPGDIVDNFNVFNNTIIAGSLASPDAGISSWHGGSFTNCSIKNNIIIGFDIPIIFISADINTISVENNLFYGNNSDAAAYPNSSVAKKTEQNNLTSNPLFVSSSDLRLQAGSPAIGKGLKITGLFTDLAGNAIKDPPSIGAYEYGSIIIPPLIPVYQSSVVENATPTLIQMTYNLSLANIVPAFSSFSVQINSVDRIVNSVTISGNKITLILESAIKFNDIVSVSYTKPLSRMLQSTSGGEAESIFNKPVTNKCLKPNDPPVLVITYEENCNSGFVYELNATGSYGANNIPLTYEWTVPNNVPVSSNNSSKIKFLAPVVNVSKIIEFQLKINDGKSTVSNTISLNILPYKPELNDARIASAKASSYQSTDYPNNVSDGSLLTYWSSLGDNQWLFLRLAESFTISHLEIAFLPDQNYSSYFDIYASKDNIEWEPILISATSCNFSGNIQVFDFPLLKTNTVYSFLKYIGHGNSLDNLNAISEFKIFGIPQQNSISGKTDESSIIIYPNPATDFFNISILDPELDPNIIRLTDLSGKIVFEDKLDPGSKTVKIQKNLNTGIYIVELLSGRITLSAQKLVISR